MKLNIVSLDNPFPPNYGGAIDIFYKLKSLYGQGYKIYLHCFYSNRNPKPELEYYCQRVYYYQRRSFIKSILNARIPFVVSSRYSKALIGNLLKNNYPILFDGLQSSLISQKGEFKNRKKYLRLHNIESDYMKQLSKAEENWIRKFGLRLDAYRYQSFEKKLNQYEAIFTISKTDQKFYQTYNNNVYLLNAFHGQQKVQSQLGIGNYILYHGNFDVSENLKVANFLIKNVFNSLRFPIKIAGKNAFNKLQPYINNSNIEIINNPNSELMKKLILDAHINILPTFQATGIKLKLINSLFLGRHCIVNNAMIAPTPILDKLCIISNSADEFINKIVEIIQLPFLQKDIKNRKDILLKYFNDLENSKILIEKIFL